MTDEELRRLASDVTVAFIEAYFLLKDNQGVDVDSLPQYRPRMRKLRKVMGEFMTAIEGRDELPEDGHVPFALHFLGVLRDNPDLNLSPLRAVGEQLRRP
jgi:hypothetical protein